MEYKSNSHKVRNEEKKPLKKIVKGNVKTKKKSEVRKFTDVFISEDLHNVKSYIIGEILIPTAKKVLSEVVTNSIDMLLYGEVGVSGKRRGSSTSRVSYQKYYDRDDYRRDRDRERYSNRGRTAGYSFDDIIFDSRGEAEQVLIAMEEEIDQYGIISVSDLCELVGISGNYTDNKYGWTSLRTADVVRTRDGYILKLPKALPID